MSVDRGIDLGGVDREPVAGRAHPIGSVGRLETSLLVRASATRCSAARPTEGGVVTLGRELVAVTPLRRRWLIREWEALSGRAGRRDVRGV